MLKNRPYINCAVFLVLYLLFLLWVGSWLGLIVVPFIFDAYVTKKIPWTWWRKSKRPVVRYVMGWVDAIVFALVAVYFVFQFFFQNYVIPSSSLEKSLLVGDYLFVSKMSYGPRIPQTPLTMPLTTHTLPIFGCKSYFEWPHWDYRRVKGFGKVKLNDIVVFNYPSGDTVALNYQDRDFYDMAYSKGAELDPELLQGKSPLAQREIFARQYKLGRDYINANEAVYGRVVSRPVDRRENYVKRCVGLPGQTLQVRKGLVYLDGRLNKQPDLSQRSYLVRFTHCNPSNLGMIFVSPDQMQIVMNPAATMDDICNVFGIDPELVKELNMSKEDFSYLYANDGTLQMPLTKQAVSTLRQRGLAVVKQAPSASYGLYPQNMVKNWTANDYGPVWIPAKGRSLKLTLANLPIYERPIAVYEGNDLKVRGGKIYINGKQTDSYTFKMDYYWMMGDNRDNSADSRFWGFVPEDHVVGKPIFVWISLDKDYGLTSGKIRWNRFFRWVDNIK